jgi:hypothetical protein
MCVAGSLSLSHEADFCPRTSTFSASISLGNTHFDALLSFNLTATPALAISASTSLGSLGEPANGTLVFSSSITSELEEEVIEEDTYIIEDDNELFPVGSAYKHGQPLEAITKEDEDEEEDYIGPSAALEMKQKPLVSR